MKNYTAEQLSANYDKFIEALKKVFKGERLEKLLHMYSEKELGTELTLAPASGRLQFHSAYAGGQESFGGRWQSGKRHTKIPPGENVGGRIVFQTQLGGLFTINKDFNPKAGEFIIFPSWLPHFTTRNSSPEIRISISSNYRFEDQRTYDEVAREGKSNRIRKLTSFMVLGFLVETLTYLVTFSIV